MAINKYSFYQIFEITIPNHINIKSSEALLLLLYNNGVLDNFNSNSIYGTLRKSIYNIPIGTPIKISIVNENTIHIYFILNSKFYSIPIELIEESVE